MEKIKWKYDKRYNSWYVGETIPYENDGLQIKKSTTGRFVLTEGYFRRIGSFRKLSSAKKVAELLRNG